ncbi:hypothetical protein BH11PLA2_BH11PLA2_15160 [soil metagenome]
MRLLFPLAILLAVSACSKAPDIGTVSGTITLDGQPIPGSLIRFIPVDGSNQPADFIITDGTYVVTIAPGEKRVEIFWLKEEGSKGDTATQGTLKQTQMIPENYNTKSTLTFTVALGSQKKDFELKSK